ncbi:hypothetical protein G5V58_20895 [Nocardioides anomalus]|uniref:Secreted protein n=1 Tax=Nocardioides anomalus TaxID=2712223 RepID=A0A6G6W8I8_9ACTN|nr:hypothetical protein [Nocardioides anomalus]QIG41360.1 hypothetical protein G5V58_20895 [Nocardioides anomalus]
MSIRTPLAAATVAVGLVAALAPTAQAAPRAGIQGDTQVIADCQHATQVPRKVLSACGDADEYARITDWRSWTRHQARGSGTLVVNDCEPTCAAGTFRRYPATFSLHRVRTGPTGTRLFTRLGVTWVQGGEQRNTTLPLPTAPLGG